MTDDNKHDSEQTSQPFLDHPETAEAGRLIMEAVQREGDRGAMLVAGEMLSAFLGDALRSIQPGAIPAEELDRLMKGLGPLASWSSRARVAALIGLISPSTLSALDDLRDVRNKAAHSDQPFALKTYHVRIRRAFDLGPNTASAINAMAVDTVMRHALEGLLARGRDLIDELGHNPFQDASSAADALSNHPEVMADLGDRTWRFELGLGVWLLLGLMRVQRDSFMTRVNP